MKENVDYEFIPADDDSWNIRVLTGPYIETVFKYGALKLIDDQLSFNIDITYSPDEELTTDDIDLQKTSGDILLDILERAVGEEDEDSGNGITWSG